MSVSVPESISIMEGDGVLEVCATLIATEPISSDLIITLDTNDGTGTCGMIESYIRENVLAFPY